VDKLAAAVDLIGVNSEYLVVVVEVVVVVVVVVVVATALNQLLLHSSCFHLASPPPSSLFSFPPVYPYFSNSNDDINAQMAKMYARFPNFGHKIRITETGWPSAGKGGGGREEEAGGGGAVVVVVVVVVVEQ